MEDTSTFFGQFLGDHNIGFHIAGILFCIMGAMLVKRHFWLKHKAQCVGVCEHPTFNIKHWFKYNWMDFGTSILVSFVVVRFIDVLLDMIDVHDVTILGVTIPITGDTVFYYLLFGALVQIWMHTKYRKKETNIVTRGITPPPGNPPPKNDPDN